MPEALRASFAEAVRVGRIRCMQNKQVTSKPLHPAGALLLGDAFNMRHPLTGGAGGWVGGCCEVCVQEAGHFCGTEPYLLLHTSSPHVILRQPAQH